MNVGQIMQLNVYLFPRYVGGCKPFQISKTLFVKVILDIYFCPFLNSENTFGNFFLCVFEKVTCEHNALNSNFII
jgi:hypothetical protein